MLLTVLIVGYSAYKLDILVNKKGNELTVIQLQDFYSDDETIKYDDGLNFAFGLYTKDLSFRLDETYGEFKVFQNTYGYTESGEYYDDREFAPFH